MNSHYLTPIRCDVDLFINSTEKFKGLQIYEYTSPI